MSYSLEHKHRTKEKILAAAGRLFKSKGYEGVGIDAIMAEAGLTRGGFYAHFPNKEDLFSQIVSPRPINVPEPETPEEQQVFLDKIFDYYLSKGHRDHPEIGCPLPALSADIAKAGGTAQNRYRVIFRKFAKILTHGLKKKTAPKLTETSYAMLSMMIGAVVVSRALGQNKTSDEVLAACRTACLELAKTPN